MIPTLEGFEVVTQEIELYPDGWQEFTNMVEFRQLGIDLYQLRSDTHMLILNEEGFILFQDETLQGQVIFEDWCRRKGVTPKPREGVTDGE